MESVLAKPVPRPRPLAVFDLVDGQPHPEEAEGEAHALQLAIRGGVASLVFSSVYGAAAGCTDPSIAAANLVKLPVVVVLGVACAMPLGLLTWKVFGQGTRLSSVAVSVTTGVFTGTLVLACAAPLIALYYLTTDFAGAPLTLGIVAIAMVGGVWNAFRAALSRRPEDVPRGRVLIPMGTMLAALLFALLQLVHLASPILPEETAFDRGIEGILGRP